MLQDGNRPGRGNRTDGGNGTGEGRRPRAEKVPGRKPKEGEYSTEIVEGDLEERR